MSFHFARATRTIQVFPVLAVAMAFSLALPVQPAGAATITGAVAPISRTLQTPLPDLVVSGHFTRDPVCWESICEYAYTLEINVSNIGAGSSTPTQLAITYPNGQTKRLAVPGLAPSCTQWFGFGPCAANLAVSANCVGYPLQIDPDNLVRESNEGNNTTVAAC